MPTRKTRRNRTGVRNRSPGRPTTRAAKAPRTTRRPEQWARSDDPLEDAHAADEHTERTPKACKQGVSDTTRESSERAHKRTRDGHTRTFTVTHHDLSGTHTETDVPEGERPRFRRRSPLIFPCGKARSSTSVGPVPGPVPAPGPVPYERAQPTHAGASAPRPSAAPGHGFNSASGATRTHPVHCPIGGSTNAATTNRRSTVDGQEIKPVAQVSKQCFVYVFDRMTGEPV